MRTVSLLITMFAAMALVGCDSAGDGGSFTDMMGNPPSPDMGSGPALDMSISPDLDMGISPDPDMNVPPEPDMGSPPDPDMGRRAPDMSTSPDPDMGIEPDPDMSPPDPDMAVPDPNLAACLRLCNWDSDECGRILHRGTVEACRQQCEDGVSPQFVEEKLACYEAAECDLDGVRSCDAQVLACQAQAECDPMGWACVEGVCVDPRRDETECLRLCNWDSDECGRILHRGTVEACRQQCEDGVSRQFLEEKLACYEAAECNLDGVRSCDTRVVACQAQAACDPLGLVCVQGVCVEPR